MRSITYRESIRQLRQTGLTFREINRRLGTNYAISTMSGICKGLVLSEVAVKRLSEQQHARLSIARKKALASNKLILRKRLTDIQSQAKAVIERVDSNQQALKVGLAMLYWGEGAKRTSYRGLSLGNSDPDLLITYLNLLEKCYSIPRSSVKARIICRSDQDQNILEDYWSHALGIERSNFYPTYKDKRTHGSKTTSEYKGVCVLSCAGADVQLELSEIARGIALCK